MALVECLEATLAAPTDSRLHACFLEFPRTGLVAEAAALEIRGWVIGERAEAVAVEICDANRVVRRVPVDVQRPERTLYRMTDRVETWGYLRARADDAVPRAVELRLIADAYDDLLDQPPVARVTATPDSRGAFAAGISYRQLPIGSYRLLAVVDGRVVASRWLEIGSIRKPAYQLALVPDRLAVVDGTTVAWTATASFFDGSSDHTRIL